MLATGGNDVPVSMAIPLDGASLPPVAEKNGKSQKPKTKKRHKQHVYVTVPHHKMSPKGHTELIIGVSRAKKREESFAEVQKSVTPQKPNKNRKKHCIFAIFLEFSSFFLLRAKRRTELKL